jgi:hypothetical protein
MSALLETLRGLLAALAHALPTLLAYVAGRSRVQASEAQADARIATAQAARAAEPPKVPNAIIERMRAGKL